MFVLGTCGGVADQLRVMDIVFAARTWQYDCDDRRPDMGGLVSDDHSWLDLSRIPHALHPGTIASADHDLTYEFVQSLRMDNALAADWESGAIALVCALNRVRWAVFRGISDVPIEPGEVDVRRQLSDYQANAPAIMKTLLTLLPEIIASVRETQRDDRSSP